MLKLLAGFCTEDQLLLQLNMFANRQVTPDFDHDGLVRRVNKSTIDGNQVPPGALVKFVQKGIQYLELETDLSNDDSYMDEDFQCLQPLDLITKNVDELQKMIEEKKESFRKINLGGRIRRMLTMKGTTNENLQEKGRRRNNRRKNSENGIEEGVKRTRTKKTATKNKSHFDK
ncbi:hypothetical protein BC332_31015 [Capsicum chinense]|nr:hypothetical protein BC332_31015 [Capsicum chinense]